MSKRLAIDEFLARCEKIHGDLYDYSGVSLTNVHTQVIIICKKHGQFSQIPRDHMLGSGCPECGKIKRAATRLGVLPSVYEESLNNRQRYCNVHGFQNSDKYYNSKVIKDERVIFHNTCKECSDKRSKQVHKELRLEIITHYSPNMNCDICGEKHLNFLAIDHINGGGNAHRRKTKQVYRDIKRNGFPSGYRVLCHNCNFKYGGRAGHNKPNRKSESELKQTKKAIYERLYTAEHPEKFRDKRKARTQKYKFDAINYYSGGSISCACHGCLCSDIDVLSIDHIDGGGHTHCKQLKSEGKTFGYQWLKSQGYPFGYRVLCLNCNMARGFYGQCPHEVK